MVGLGGGFISVPILLIFFGLAPAEASGTSLALVLANSASGAFTYALQKRVHVKIGLLVAIGGFPASIAGAFVARHIPAQLYDWIFAALLVGVSIDMVRNRHAHVARRRPEHLDDEGPVNVPRFLVVGLVVGFVSSLFGVGGGVIIIPSLLYFSTLTAHMISATSQFAILLTSPVGLAAHWAQNDVDWRDVVPLALGGVIGGPIGARLSLKLRQTRLLTAVAAAMMVAALILVLRHFTRA